VYQAYFYPEKLENFEARKWVGFLHALFVDNYGNLREDTNENDALDSGD
jgi:type IV pilus assembly protein PilY1